MPDTSTSQVESDQEDPAKTSSENSQTPSSRESIQETQSNKSENIEEEESLPETSDFIVCSDVANLLPSAIETLPEVQNVRMSDGLILDWVRRVNAQTENCEFRDKQTQQVMSDSVLGKRVMKLASSAVMINMTTDSMNNFVDLLKDGGAKMDKTTKLLQISDKASVECVRLKAEIGKLVQDTMNQ